MGILKEFDRDQVSDRIVLISKPVTVPMPPVEQPKKPETTTQATPKPGTPGKD